MHINDLKNRVLKKSDKSTDLTGILDLIRGLGCFSDVIGRDFELFDKDGALLYTIRQKPLSIKQLNVMLKEFSILKKLDIEQEAAKWKK